MEAGVDFGSAEDAQIAIKVLNHVLNDVFGGETCLDLCTFFVR